MAYKQFETDNAWYHMCLANHNIPSLQDFERVDITTLDAVVLENGGSSNIDDIVLDNQYNGIFQSIKNNNPNLPVYLVDIFLTSKAWMLFYITGHTLLTFTGLMLLESCVKNMKDIPSAKGNRRELLKSLTKGAAKLGAGALLFSDPFNWSYGLLNSRSAIGEEESAVYNTLTSFHEFFIPDPAVSFRSAHSARKIEEYVVPKLKEKSQNLKPSQDKKPRIALVYGAGHTVMKQYLQSEWRRNMVIGFFDKLDFPCLDKQQLDDVWVIRYNENEHSWSIIGDKAGLYRLK